MAKNTTRMSLRLDDIVINEELYPRVQPDWLTVHQYSESVRNEEPNFPPIEVTLRSGNFILIDGRHRLEAFRKAGHLRIKAIVHKNLTDKQIFKRAVEINVRHGRQLSVQERAAAANRLLREFNFSKKDVSHITSMPIESYENLIQARIENVERTGLAALVMTKKGPVKNASLGDSVPQVQGSLAAISQRQIFTQAIDIVENDLLDRDDEKVMELVVKLRGLLVSLVPARRRKKTG